MTEKNLVVKLVIPSPLRVERYIYKVQFLLLLLIHQQVKLLVALKKVLVVLGESAITV